MILSRRQLLKAGAVSAAGAALPVSIFKATNSRAALQPYSTPLPILPKARPTGPNQFTLTARQGNVVFHPSLGNTKVYGYDDGSGRGVHTPGYVIEATKGTPTTVNWVNNLPGRHLFDSTVPDYMYAGAPVRMNTHLHGGYVAGTNDGNPYATPGEFVPGQTQRAVYPNQQNSTLLWYHDHGDQITRLNVYAGLVGLYILRDAQDTGAENNPLGVPGGAYEIPLVFSDRLFDAKGELFYSDTSEWIPEFFGDTAIVNGAVQPYLEVEPRMYRFRILSAANARFFNLNIEGAPAVAQIGSDGGLFNKPVSINGPLLLLPSERADVLVDFSKLAGRTLEVTNAPVPGDVSTPAPDLAGGLMQIRVGTRVTTPGPKSFPKSLPGSMASLGAPSLTRNITLEEVEGPDGPLYGSLNGRKFDDARGVQETPKLGATEDWRLINTTEDTHPIHLHLVQFQIVDRTPFDAEGYAAALDAARANNSDAPNPDPTPFLTGRPQAPDANERGWKDVVRTNPGQVTRIRAKWTLPAGVSPEQKYVFHCHILEHEDNSMMRPLKVVS